MSQFIRFIPEQEIYRTDNSIVFRCIDTQSNYKYILHLPKNLENSSFLIKNKNEEFQSIEDIRRRYLDRNIPRDIQIFGVIDSRYLISISEPYFIKDVLSIDEVINKCPSNDLHLFGAWESIALTMMSEAHMVDEKRMTNEEWLERWSLISGGQILVDAISSYMDNGDLSRTEKLRVIDRISIKRYDYPELAENILLRLIGAYTRDRISPEVFIQTLLCSDFQRNISIYEYNQMNKAFKALNNDTVPDAFNSVNSNRITTKWIYVVLSVLSQSNSSVINSFLSDNIINKEYYSNFKFDFYLEAIN